MKLENTFRLYEDDELEKDQWVVGTIYPYNGMYKIDCYNNADQRKTMSFSMDVERFKKLVEGEYVDLTSNGNHTEGLKVIDY